MQWSSRQKLGIGLLVFSALSSWASWQVLERAVLVEGASSFLIPSLSVAGLLLLVFLGSLVWQERSFQWLAASFLVIPSMLSALSLSHGLVMILAIGLIAFGLHRIHQELHERIHLSIRKSILLGTTPLLLAISLLLSSQYYVHAEQLSWNRLVPSFNLAEGFGPLAIKLIAPFYPEMQKLNDAEVTVDSFLTEVQTREKPSWIEFVPPAGQETLLKGELERTKSELGRLLGRQVMGHENMQALLAEIIQQKTFTLLSKEQQILPVPILPFILSLLLFLTVYPLMAFLAPLVVLIVIGLFQLLRRTGWLVVKTESVEREFIAE